MKLLYITYARIPTEKAHGLQIVKMCEAYARLGHEVELLVPAISNVITDSVFSYYGLKNNFVIRHMRTLTLPYFGSALGFWAYKLNIALFALRSLYIRVPSDAIVITRTPEIAWLYARRGKKIICEVHDWPQSFERFFLWLLKDVSLIVCNSEGTQREFVQRGIKHALVAHNGVDVEKFSRRFDKGAARRALDLPLDKNIVMYVGSLEAWKGVPTLLEASTLLPEDTLVVIIGGREGEIEQLSREYPGVHFVGPRPYAELPRNQQAADLLVVPNSAQSTESVRYTSPIKLFAHLCSKVPVVVSDLPSIRAIVSQREAFFSPPDDPRALADMVRYVLAHPQDARTRAQEGGRIALQHSWQARAQRILSHLQI